MVTIHGEPQAGFEDYVCMDHMGQPASVATRRESRQSGIDDPMPFQPDAVRMRGNTGDDEQIYEICYDYKARQHDELDLRRGSVIKVVKDAETGWYQGLVDGKIGLFPSNYIRAIGPANFKKCQHYEVQILGVIGEGAAGEVFRARYQGKEVAFKKFKSLGRERESEKEMVDKMIYNVKREAAHLNNFHHKNIVALHAVCLHPQHVGLVLELCQGGTLSQVYRRVVNAAVPKRILVDWALQICSAMEACAAGKFVHRDLKMDNVLVLQKVCFCALPNGKTTPDRPNADFYSHDKIQANGVCIGCGGTAFDKLKLKLTDFGLSRENSNDLNRQSLVSAAGTSAWIAPEAYQKNEFSEKSDVWSFGVVLWELVTRKTPYEKVLDNAMIPFFVAKGFIRLEMTKEFPEAVATIIKECLQMEPADRPRFKQIRKELDVFMEHLMKINDPTEYIEQQKLEAAIRDDIKALKKAGAFEEHIKQIEEEIKKFESSKVPTPVERAPHKKVDKSQIGEPTEPRILLHIPAGGTLPKNIDWMGRQESLKPSLSKSQPNLNQIHTPPQKISRDRHHGIRKKKERANEDISGFDDGHRESSSGNYDDHDSVGSPFSQSHDERTRSSVNGSEKRGSDGNVSFKGLKVKDGHSTIHRIKNFFKGRREGRSPAPRHSSISVDSNDDPDHSVTPSRSQSVSSSLTTSLLYNTMRTPIDVGMMMGNEKKNGGKSPDRRISNGLDNEERRRRVLPTHNTKTYTKISPLPHPASSPAAMNNGLTSPTPSGYSATNCAYSTFPSAAGHSRPSGLSSQQPLHQHFSSTSSSSSNTPVGMDEQYPPGGGGVPDDAPYHQLHPSVSSSSMPPRLPPELPPRRRAEFNPGLSTIVPVEQSSPTAMDQSNLPPGAIRGRSRTVSGCTADSPGYMTSSPYIEMPSTAAIAASKGLERGGGRRDSSPDYVCNDSYEPYRRMTRAPCSPPLTEPPPLPPALPPKMMHHGAHSAPVIDAEYHMLTSK